MFLVPPVTSHLVMMVHKAQRPRRIWQCSCLLCFTVFCVCICSTVAFVISSCFPALSLLLVSVFIFAPAPVLAPAPILVPGPNPPPFHIPFPPHSPSSALIGPAFAPAPAPASSSPQCSILPVLHGCWFFCLVIPLCSDSPLCTQGHAAQGWQMQMCC